MSIASLRAQVLVVALDAATDVPPSAAASATLTPVSERAAPLAAKRL